MSDTAADRLQAALDTPHLTIRATTDYLPDYVLVPRADLSELLDDHADDFVWTQWAVQIHFPRRLTTVDHDSETEARDHHRQLLAGPGNADRIELVSRTNIQGTYRPVTETSST